MVIMLWMTIESSIVSSSSLTEELSQKHQNDDIVALFDAINRLVEFFTADPEARTADAKLGMVIARGWCWVVWSRESLPCLFCLEIL